MNSGHFGKYPGVVVSYDAPSRTCQVNTPVSGGGDSALTATILYPIGDRSAITGTGTTEINILPGDTVWVEFEMGDKRYPIIVGYRNPGTGNSTGTRAFNHANIALTASNLMTFTAANLNIHANVNITGTLTNNGVNISSTHTHSGVAIGTHNTGTPV